MENIGRLMFYLGQGKELEVNIDGNKKVYRWTTTRGFEYKQENKSYWQQISRDMLYTRLQVENELYGIKKCA